MQHPVLDLLRTSLVPELRTDIAAGSPCHTHLRLITVSAVGALPYQLAALILYDLNLTVVAADLTVIRLRIQLRIHDVVINILHHGEHCRNVVLHVRHLNVADGTTRRKPLEVRLEAKLGEGINILPDIYMVAVGDVVVVRYVLNDAEALLQALGKLIGRGFHRCSVE